VRPTRSADTIQQDSITLQDHAVLSARPVAGRSTTTWNGVPSTVTSQASAQDRLSVAVHAGMP
jgi:hypothetical protein